MSVFGLARTGGATARPMSGTGAAMGWRERWRTLRNRLLASPGFQRWAAGFPLTRPVANTRAQALFDICAGFVYSQVLLACVRLDLFEVLAEGAQTATALSHRLDLSPDAAERLLRAAAALGLAEAYGDGRFGLGELGAAMRANPGIAAMVEHHPILYGDLSDPVALLRGERSGTALADFWPYAEAESASSLEPGRVSAYTALMAASQPLIADDILDAYPIGRHRRLLDVGGGDGSFLTAAAARAPDLDLMLFDLPPVAALARERFRQSGLASRATVYEGDFSRDALPSGADLITLVRIVHDHSDEAVKAMLRAAHRALEPGGTLLVAEPMAGETGHAPVADAYFGFYLLAMGKGRARTPAEIGSLLETAGFRHVRSVRTRRSMLTRLIIAQADNE